jgi:hypothetical protein
MRRTRILIGLVVATSVLAVVARAAGDQPPAGFRLPDASAACRPHGTALVCRSLVVHRGVAISGRGSPRGAAESIWWDASTPVLHRWSHDGVTCAERGGRIACANAVGKSVTLGPTGIDASI